MQNNVIQEIYFMYAEICTKASNISACTNKELTYFQWMDQRILKDIPNYIMD